ncbi:hypothetical protein EV127DRAFT_503635 [Xylaria flabelliformis]|nr:hypothetical protein EV127DRAFT_503635 [Xylaria flabelliformis]
MYRIFAMDGPYDTDEFLTPYDMVPKTQSSKLDDAPHSDHYMPVREAYLRQIMIETLTKKSLRSEKDMYQYENYLRKKWQCTEAIPDSFDPDKLEAMMKSRFPSKNICGEPSETPKVISLEKDDSQNTSFGDEFSHTSADIDSCEFNAPHGSILFPNMDDEHEITVDDLEVLIDDVTSAWSQLNLNTVSGDDQTLPETSERASTPRIGAGSKPPLSPSAFAGGVYTDEQCQCKKLHVRRKSKPSGYFPFHSRERRRSRSE